MYKFKPLLKSTLWGGEKIIPFKQLNSTMTQVGESWELSGVPGYETVVSEGAHQGLTLNQLVDAEHERLLGVENYQRFGNEFPLLIKFIDAQRELLRRFHPWVFSGAVHHIDGEVSEGDVFYIPAGRIHSLGEGCVVAEIQQTSDVTFRIYDFKRKDKNGNYRELHTKEAAQSIDYKVMPDYRTHYTPKKNEGVLLVSSPYFTTAVYDLDEPMTLDYSDLDSFVVLIGVKGSATLTDNEGQTTTLRAGETVLIPACTKEINVKGEIKFLETYV